MPATLFSCFSVLILMFFSMYSLHSLEILCNVTNLQSDAKFWQYLYNPSTKSVNICAEFGIISMFLSILLSITVYSFAVGPKFVIYSQCLRLGYILKITYLASVIGIEIYLIVFAVQNMFGDAGKFYELHLVESGLIALLYTIFLLFWLRFSVRKPLVIVSHANKLNFMYLCIILCNIFVAYQRYSVFGLCSLFWCEIGVCLCSMFYVVSMCFDYCINYPESQRLFEESDSQNFITPVVNLGAGDYNKNYLSQFLFCWTNPLLLKGRKGQLNSPEDVFHLPPPISVERVKEEVDRHQKNENQSLASILWSTFGFEYLSLGILKFFGDNLVFAGPILLNLLVKFIQDRSQPMKIGVMYCGLLFCASLASALFGLHFNYRINRLGIKIKGYVIPRIYRKLLSVSLSELWKSELSCGMILNLMSVDSTRIVNFCPSFHSLWSLPIQLVIALYLLYRQVGISFLAGVGFALVLVPINWVITSKIGKLSTKMMYWKDRRVQLMRELLCGIRVVKTSAAENHFLNKVNALREQEIKYLKARKYLDALCVYLWAAAPNLIALMVFFMYTKLGNQLDAATVFTVLSLMGLLIMPLNAFPWVLTGFIEATVSLKRVNQFLKLTQIDHQQYYTPKYDGNAVELSVEHASFSWNPHNSTPTLSNISFDFWAKEGQLIGIVGPVGCGKTTLLCALLGEVNKDIGVINLRGQDILDGMSYVSQEAWLQNTTVRENICFGKIFRHEFYSQVVQACALLPDFQVMSKGDLTFVGEEGVTLSGGQKIRLALARAIYHDVSIYLLDDPLASLDAKVGRHVFDQAIMKLLICRGKTVILVTHHTKMLAKADFVLKLDSNGTIEKCGTPGEVVEFEDRIEEESFNEENKSTDIKDNQLCGEGMSMSEEEMEVGTVKSFLYWVYATNIGPFACLIALAFIAMQVSKNSTDWFLSYWVDQTNKSNNSTGRYSSHSPNFYAVQGFYMSSFEMWTKSENSSAIIESGAKHDINFYLMIYAILAGSNSLFTLLRAFFFAYGGINATKKMHNKLLKRVLKAPINFFDRTPLGRIVNRFSNDVYAIDETLPFQGNILVTLLFSCVGSLVMIIYGLPWFIIPIIGVAFIYYYVQRYYRYTTCELKRIVSVSQSPIFSHFNHTISGLATIRAFRDTKRFVSTLTSLVSDNLRGEFSVVSSSCWLGIRIQFMGVFIVTCVATIAIIQHHYSYIDPGMVGLCVSYSLGLTSLLNGLVQYFTDTEMEMVAVERINHYIQCTPIENYTPIIKTPIDWPSEGGIEFNEVTVQYSPGASHALHNVSFYVKPGQKVAIIGRTGAGKSSIFQALLRAVEITSGEIKIDSINVTHLNLLDLRCNISIISQHPFVFTGTLAQNILFGTQASNSQLSTIIKECHLDGLFCRIGGLEGNVGEQGCKLSLGEKQLLCLARALLRKSKMILMDEATAHMDSEVHQAIHNSLLHKLPNVTVLSICHRLDRLRDFDVVLTVDNAKVKQSDVVIEL